MPAAFTVERADLLPALTAVAKIPEKRNTIPILSNVLIEATAGQLRLTATDLDIQVTRRVPAEVTGEGVFTVPADTIFDLVKRLPAAARITIEDGTAPGSASLRAGRSRYTLRTLPVADFPNLQEAGEYTHTIEATCGHLAGLFATVAFAISTEATRFYLNGTFLHVVPSDQGNALRLVATDGHRLAQIGSTTPTGLDPDMPGIIVPTKAQHELRRLCEASPEAAITLEVSPRQIRAAMGDTVFISKLVDGTFPDYQRITPKTFVGSVKLGVEEATGAIERAMVMTLEKSRMIRLDLAEAHMAISVANEGGEAIEEVEAEFAGPDKFRIGFNGRYLAEVLENLGSETATLRLAETPNGRAAVITARDDAPSLFVLMAMRT